MMTSSISGLCIKTSLVEPSTRTAILIWGKTDLRSERTGVSIRRFPIPVRETKRTCELFLILTGLRGCVQVLVMLASLQRLGKGIGCSISLYEGLESNLNGVRWICRL